MCSLALHDKNDFWVSQCDCLASYLNDWKKYAGLLADFRSAGTAGDRVGFVEEMCLKIDVR